MNLTCCSARSLRSLLCCSRLQYPEMFQVARMLATQCQCQHWVSIHGVLHVFLQRAWALQRACETDENFPVSLAIAYRHFQARRGASKCFCPSTVLAVAWGCSAALGACLVTVITSV